MNCTTDADISSAAADIGKVGIDISVGRLRVLLQKCHRRHDLTGLAVAALRDILCKPGLLHGMPAVGRQAFDGGDFLIDDINDLDTAPSTCTVQAPHCAMPQPNFVPVIPSSSRMTQRSGVSGSISSEYAFPFTVSAIMEPSLVPA